MNDLRYPTQAEHDAAMRLAALTAHRLNAATGGHFEAWRIKDGIIAGLPDPMPATSRENELREVVATALSATHTPTEDS